MSTEISNRVSFEIAYKQLMNRWEDPHMEGKVTVDRGGTTKYGISEASFPSLDIKSITTEKAKEIAKLTYWDQPKWDLADLHADYQMLANKLFQFGFNVGTGTVIQVANLCIFIAKNRETQPKLGEPLVLAQVPVMEYVELTNMLAAAQLSRYIKDYHHLSQVPHSLLDRALCVE